MAAAGDEEDTSGLSSVSSLIRVRVCFPHCVRLVGEVLMGNIEVNRDECLCDEGSGGRRRGLECQSRESAPHQPRRYMSSREETL